MRRPVVFLILLTLLIAQSAIPLFSVSQAGEIVLPNVSFFNHPTEELLVRRAGDTSSFVRMLTGPRVFLSRYLESFRLDYYFFPSQQGTFPLPGAGFVSLVALIALPIGVYTAIRDRKQPFVQLSLLAFSLLPVLNIAAPNPTFLSILLMSIVLNLMAAVGLTELVFFKKRYWPVVLALAIGMLLLSAWYAWHQFFAHELLFSP